VTWWRRWRWRRTHRPYDWRRDCPELLQAPAVRRVWPNPGPPWDQLRPVFTRPNQPEEEATAYDTPGEAAPQPWHPHVSESEQQREQ